MTLDDDLIRQLRASVAAIELSTAGPELDAIRRGGAHRRRRQLTSVGTLAVVLIAAGTLVLTAGLAGDDRLSPGYAGNSAGGADPARSDADREAVLRPPESTPLSPDTTGSVEDSIVAPSPLRLAATDEFGLVTSVEQDGDGWRITVDRVRMLGEPAQGDAAAPNDDTDKNAHLVNDSPVTRNYSLAPDAVFWGNTGLGQAPDAHVQVSFDTWKAFITSTDQGRQTPWHFQIDGARVVGVEQQYEGVRPRPLGSADR